MESTKATVNYIIHTTVTAIEHKKDRHYLSGVGNDTKFTETSRGWWLFLQGSYEAIYLGEEQPNLAPGDKMKITIEKV